MESDAIIIYEIACGGIRRQLCGHNQPIQALAYSSDGSKLLSTSNDATGLVWELAPTRSAPSAALSDDDLNKRWDRLLSSDSAAAFQALGDLAATPDKAISLLQKKLTPTFDYSPVAVDLIIFDLDSKVFAVRESEADKLG